MAMEFGDALALRSFSEGWVAALSRRVATRRRSESGAEAPQSKALSIAARAPGRGTRSAAAAGVARPAYSPPRARSCKAANRRTHQTQEASFPIRVHPCPSVVGFLLPPSPMPTNRPFHGLTRRSPAWPSLAAPLRRALHVDRFPCSASSPVVVNRRVPTGRRPRRRLRITMPSGRSPVLSPTSFCVTMLSQNHGRGRGPLASLTEDEDDYVPSFPPLRPCRRQGSRQR